MSSCCSLLLYMVVVVLEDLISFDPSKEDAKVWSSNIKGLAGFTQKMVVIKYVSLMLYALIMCKYTCRMDAQDLLN